MRIGVIRTAASPCRCGEAVSQGLRALGHEPLLVDSEEIELRLSELAHTCDLVIDHTDTLRGRGLYRFVVRSLLETHGARIAGSDARACLLADDKVAAKACLSGAGIPVPPGVSVTTQPWNLPSWLPPPLVIKPAFEHMSRGVRLLNTGQEAYGAAAQLLESLRQPVLVEGYIPGRELAVSLLEGPKGLQVLPPLEWRLGGGPGFLTEGSKLAEPVGERRDVLRADLPDDLHSEMEALARHAFRALGLRDYARFDIRLSSGGTLFFLEANTTPSLEPLEALALSARWAGLDYPALVERMLSAALRRYKALPSAQRPSVRIELPTGPIELEIPEGVHVPPPSSIDLARLLDVRQGEDVLDLGCGSGLLSIAAAKLGARRVVAIDLDSWALQATAQNAHRNGVSDKVELRAGSWYEPLHRRSSSPGGQEDRFDVIIATPPQTPGLEPFGPKYGGPNGTRHLLAAIDGAPAFLKPVQGRLWLMAISLANPPALWRQLRDRFADVTLLRETERPFIPKEYETLQEGLFEHLLALRASGHSEFAETKSGGYVFRNLFICATGPRKP